MRKAIIEFVLICLFICSCGIDTGRYYKPDDEISKSITDSQSNSFIYCGKNESKTGEKIYSFIIKKIEPDAVVDFYNNVSSIIRSVDEYVKVGIYGELPDGRDCILYISNYTKSDEIKTVEDGCLLEIRNIDHFSYKYDIFRDPQLYTNLSNVKILKIDRGIQKKAENCGIDWYEIWPELEAIIITGRNNKTSISG